MTVIASDAMTTPKAKESSTPTLFNPSNETAKSPNEENNNDSNPSIQQTTDNQALMTALGASPCFSLGLGSSSSDGQGTNAGGTPEAINKSDVINDSILSNNVTVRKSMRVSSGEKTKAQSDEESSDTSSLLQFVLPSDDEVTTAPLSCQNVESAELFPEKMTTTVVLAKNFSNAQLSPMSADDFDASATNFAAPMVVTGDIAGLSPIMATRESDVRMLTSPVGFQVDAPVEATDALSKEPIVQSSFSPRAMESPQNASVEQKPSEEEAVESLAHDHDFVVESGKERVEEDEVMAKEEEKAVNHVPPAPSRLSTSESIGESQSLQDENTSLLEPSLYTTSGNEQEETGSVAETTSASATSEFGAEQHSLNQSTGTTDASSPIQEATDSNALAENDGERSEECSIDDNVAAAADRQELAPTTLTLHPKQQSESISESETNSAGDKNIEDSTHSPLPKATEVQAQETSESSVVSSHDIESASVDSPSSTDNGDDDTRKNQTDTPVYRDLTSAKKKLDASSMTFIERLRGAANRRKRRVLQSRDSLAAKEKEHLISIASANEHRLIMAPKAPPPPPTNVRPADPAATVVPYKPFKARPAPSTTGHLGSGGQVGVPKVEKKPTTTPFSPLLGARRPQKEKVSALESQPRQNTTRLVSTLKSITPKKKARGHSLPFKARPVPSTTGSEGHGGQIGVPKVPKRPATVPVSPCLGNRRYSLPAESKPKKRDPKPSFVDESRLKREATSVKPFAGILSGSEATKAKEAARLEQLQHEADKDRRAREFRARPMPKTTVSRKAPTSASPVLLGLNILNNDIPPPTSGSENVEPQIATPRNQQKPLAYEPHSTARAKKRASFDERRALHEIERQEQNEKLRKSMIKQKRSELSKFGRESLR